MAFPECQPSRLVDLRTSVIGAVTCLRGSPLSHHACTGAGVLGDETGYDMTLQTLVVVIDTISA